MIRALIAVSVCLGVLCSLQWRAVRDLKDALADRESRAESACLSRRADELPRTLVWVDQTLRAGGVSAGLWSMGPLDENAVRELVVDGYLQRRAAGASELEARDHAMGLIEARRPGS